MEQQTKHIQALADRMSSMESQFKTLMHELQLLRKDFTDTSGRIEDLLAKQQQQQAVMKREYDVMMMMRRNGSGQLSQETAREYEDLSTLVHDHQAPTR